MVAVPDWLLLSAQGVHQLGAIAWVGGSIFYKLVLQRAFRKAGTESSSIRTIGQEFGRIVRVAIAILVITGAFMAVVHLSAGGNSRVYIGILALKIALAFYMFLVVFLKSRASRKESPDDNVSGFSRLRRALSSTTALLILGIAVIGLADVLGAVGHGDGGHGHGGDSGGGEENGHSDATDEPVDHHEAEEGEIEVEEEEELEEIPDTPTSEPGSGGSDGHDHDH